MRGFLGVLGLTALVCLGGAASAQTTMNVPVGDPAYEELDILRAAGRVSGLIVGQRPYSRLQFARFAWQARAGTESRDESDEENRALTPRQREALARLENWFSNEIDLICGEDVGEVRQASRCGELSFGFHPRVARADVTQLQSPWRPIPTLYDLPADFIDARLNPLVDTNLGRDFVDGWTGGVEGGAEVQLASYGVVYVHPRLTAVNPRGGSGDTDVDIHQLYARSVFGNLAIELGRDHVMMGQVGEAGTFVSHNPRGLDMIRLSNERPFRLPWLLDVLGPVSLSLIAADLGSNREIEHAKLFLTRGSIRPHPNLELGLSSLNVQGGEGAPTGDFWERVADVLVPGVVLPQFSEKVAGVDARLTLPGPGLELYLEFTNTDPDFRRFTQAVTHEAAWVVGTAVPSFGPEGRFSARGEWRRNGFRPYTHHQYTSGLTLDGLVIGSPLGPAATGASGQIGWSGTVHQLQVSANLERYRGDEYRNVPDPETGRLSWEQITDNPDEVRFRLEGEWSRLALDDNFRPSVRVGWETVDRFAFGVEGRTNWMASATVAYHW